MSIKKGRISSNEGLPVVFDGVNDYFSRSESNFRNGDSQGTISIWFIIKQNPISKTHILFSILNSDNTRTLNVAVNSSGNLQFQIVGNTGVRFTCITTTILPNTIYNVVIDSNTTIHSVRINNVLQTLNYLQGSNNGQWFDEAGLVTTRIHIGTGYELGSGYSISEIICISYSNQTLTSTERTALYNNGIPLGLKSLPKTLRNKITNFWQPKDKYTYKDLVGGLDLSANGNPQYVEKSKVISNQGLPVSLDNTGDYFSTAFNEFRGSDNVGTFWAWVTIGETSSAFRFFSVNSDIGRYRFLVFRNIISGFQIVVDNDVFSTNYSFTTTALNQGETYLIVVNSNGSTYNGYVNNITQSKTINFNDLGDGAWFNDITGSNTDNIFIGADKFNGNITSPNGGYQIHQVGYSNNVLNNTELTTLYNNGVPLGLKSLPKSLRNKITNFWQPKDKYTYEDIAGGLDLTANGNPEYSLKPTTYYKGNLGHGLNFPNVLSTDTYYVNVPHSSSINFNTSDPFSISTWVYFETIPSAPTGGTQIIGKVNDDVIALPRDGWRIITTPSNLIQFSLASDEPPRLFAKRTVNAIEFNKIYNIVITKNTTYSDVEIYFNSILQESVIAINTFLPSDTISNTKNLTIGRYLNYENIPAPLDGKMFNTQIFNKVLTQEEITYLYKTEGVIPTSAKSSCVLNLPFNERDGLVVKDYSGQGNNGSLVNYSVAETTKGPNNNWIDGYTFKPLI